jgi:ABC-type uncharacterized transport system substrate-binding protein
MRRRAFIFALAGAAAWSLVARAQQGDRMRRVGVLMSYAENDPEAEIRLAALHEGLRKLGWTDGRNIQIDCRYGTDVKQIPILAAELVAWRPDVIVVNSNLGTAALRRETRAIPIVFVLITDPVASGFAESLSRPNGNATGFTNYEHSIGSKWLELLKQIAPNVARVAVVVHPETAANLGILRAAEAAAASLRVTVVPLPVHDASEIEGGVTAFAAQPHGGLVVVPHPVTQANRDLLARLSARHALPAVSGHSLYARAGFLISYGIGAIAAPEAFRSAATYVDRILKGERPQDLPIQQPTKFDLVVNLNTAKALGLDVPLHLQQLADEVIE